MTEAKFDVFIEATLVLVKIAQYKKQYNTANVYSVSLVEKLQAGVNKTFIIFGIRHENSFSKQREFGPYNGYEKAIEALIIELRKMIDEANQDLNIDTTGIMMYPAWLL